MTTRSLWIALGVLVLFAPVLGTSMRAWAGVPVVQGAAGWGC